MTREEITAYFGRGIDCGQVVLLALSEELGISRAEAMRLGAGLGGGMFDGDTCGAYFAGIIAIGLKFGPTEEMDEQDFQLAKGQVMSAVVRFKAAFTEKFGDCNCEKLLGYKIPEQMGEAVSSGRMMSYCPALVEGTIGLLREILKG